MITNGTMLTIGLVVTTVCLNQNPHSISAGQTPVRQKLSANKSVTGIWRSETLRESSPHDVVVVNTLTINAGGTASLSLLSKKSGKESKFKLTWVEGADVIAFSFVGLHDAVAISRSRQTAYASISADGKTLSMALPGSPSERYRLISSGSVSIQGK